ncbi:hypothetical protein ACLKA6_006290 [Drosophila palustris]
MMETLEQQQTKSTPNIEPHAGDTETTPAASEEDDFEDNIETSQLETEEKSKSPQSELKVNDISEENNVQNSKGLAIENGQTKEEPSEPLGLEKVSSGDSLDEPLEPSSINCVKAESKDVKEVSVPEEKPSASHLPVSPDSKQPEIDMKIEEESSLHVNICNNDQESSSTDVKIVEDYESGDDERNDEEATCSPAIKVSENTCSQEKEKEDKTLKTRAVEESDVRSLLEDDKKNNEAAIDENVTKEQSQTSPAASPVYKIADLSPASIPDDEESLQDFNTEMNIDGGSLTQLKVEAQSPMEVIKIESDSDVEDAVSAPKEEKATAEHSDQEKLPMETSVKMKINGAHTAMVQQEFETDDDDNEKETEKEESVIANNAGNEVEQVQQLNNTRISSRSSSVSSTSQQLVIDHPESEQTTKHQQRQQKVLQLQQAMLELKQVQREQMLHATKRRRSGSNDEVESKQQRIEEQSSLLMQRLQAPASNSHEVEKLLSCYKCNANNFENFQQLNEHYAICGQPKEPPLAAATTTATVACSNNAPIAAAASAAPIQSPVSNPVTIKKERFFRCARCSTVHQCWNFFLHMREVHQRYICLYCSHVFASVEKLSLHLENKHDMDQLHFNNVEAWQTLQTLEDRARYLVCCNCQASFERGSQFDDHDCAELMQPCALCGQKMGHANGCRNGSRKKIAVRRKRKTAKSKHQLTQLVESNKQLEEVPNWLETDLMPGQQHELNIPAPSVDTPQEEDALPKLVVPKIMLRVPKEFQKSVDAALSSTDTEDEDNDELPSTATDDCSSAPLLTVDAVHQQQQQLMLPLSNLSEDTETATETASTFLETTTMVPNVSAELEGYDSSTDKLTLMVAELERTKRHIERTKAHILAKQEQQEQQQQQQPPSGVAMEQQPQEELQQQEEQRRWSPTPPASPHNNHMNAEKHVPKEGEQEEQQEMQLDVQESKTEPGLETETSLQRRDSLGSECMDIDDSLMEEQQQQQEKQQSEQSLLPVAPLPPADGIEVASEETHTMDLQLDRPLDKFELVDFVRLCLKAVYPFCLYCNHARRIAVNAKQLVLHLIGQHRFTATVDSITAEELHAETIVARLKSYLPVVEGGHYLNSASCCSLEDGRFAQPFNERIYECFQCRYVTATHKELYTHNRRLHAKAIITCTMCRINFFSYSELLCHICPGVTTSNIYEVQFRCCLCENSPTLPSAFRLMVHLRKQHHSCDICLEDCHTQAKLSSHVWKHKLLHLCYRCGIAYRNKQDISKHLFWKHGTESAGCKRCLQKRWRHVYHFCIPATQFTCEHCQFSFSKAIYLEVHKRQHVGDFRYACTEDQCEEKFVSRKLLLKHAAQHEIKELPSNGLEAIEGTKTSLDEEKRRSRSASEQPENKRNSEEVKTEKEEEIKPEATVQVDGKQEVRDKTPQEEEQTQRKRRKKSKRNKASLEDLNLIAPNLSESDSSDDSDSDAPRSTGAQPETAHGTLPMRSSVDDLDMPRVMLSPASESDNEEQDKDKELPKPQSAESETQQEQEQEQLTKQLKEEDADDDEHKPKVEAREIQESSSSQEVADIWKNLLQHQPTIGKTEVPVPIPVVEIEPSEEQLRPSKLHVAFSDHDYCKMQRTPPPTPAPVPSPKKLSRSTPNKAKRGNASSDSDSSSSSSSNSDTDSSSCSCGSNCSCSSSGSSSSDDDSDNESNRSSGIAKKAQKKTTESESNNTMEEEVNVTSVNEEEPRPMTPTPKAPFYNESDFDTAISDTDEEFYDAHPQKMANELLAQKRMALISAQAHEQAPGESSNYDIVENSRPSTPSLPEEAAAFADKRERISKNKKKKRERKSTCKSTSQGKLQAAMPPMEPQQFPQHLPYHLPQQQQQQLLPHQSSHFLNAHNDSPAIVGAVSAAPFQLADATQMTQTPLTHRPGWQPRMSEGSSCSDADGQLKRSKRTRRPNKFYGYTSDDENMSSVLAPPLQVGMQLIKPQPPPQLTWAKEDLPTPPKQPRSRNNYGEQQSNHQHLAHQHSNSNGSTRKRNKRTPLSGGSGSAKRSAKRVKQQPQPQQLQQQPPVEQLEQHHLLPPIPTLKIRPALLPASAAASDSSDSSSDEDENAEINVTSLLPLTAPRAPPLPMIHHPVAPPAAQPAPVPLPAPPPPAPATRAFNQPIPPALLPNPDFATLQYFKANNIRYPIRPPAGARLAREGESVYCYCRCPYDEVSEMIACDGDNCLIEWFHFECVGIMVAPQGKWFCAECRPKYSEGLYMGVKAK